MPIVLRTGKRLARKVTEIAVHLKPVPHLAFQSKGSVGVQPNQLILTVQPNEGVSLSLGAKIPGATMRIRPVNMEFLYGTSFMSQSPEAYERLILDAMRGDATLFTRNDEVDAQWSIIDPILKAWSEGRPPLAEYEAGTPGPAEADALLGEGRHWRALCNGRGLVRARHDAGEDRGGAAARSSPSTTTPTIRRPRPRAQPGGGGGRRVPRRDREPLRARRPLSPVAARAVRGRGRPHDARRVGGRRHRGRRAGPGPHRDARERVEIEIGPKHLSKLDTIVEPLLVPDLATMVWAPHGHNEAVDSLRRLAQIVLVDTQDEPDVGDSLARVDDLSEHAYVVDLAWLRSTPWRERVAAAFDPPHLRTALGGVRRSPSATATTRGRRAAVLRLAVVAAGLEAGAAGARGRWLVGHARARRQEVRIELDRSSRTRRGWPA